MIKARLRRAKALMNIMLDHFYDARRYFVHSQSGRYQLNPGQLRGRLLQKAHSIEKGLSMPRRRAFFGKAALRQLEQLIAMYEAQGLSEDHVSIHMARGAIRAYFEAHAGAEIPTDIARFEALALPGTAPADTGTITLTRADQIAAGQGTLKQVMRSRRSSRVFAHGTVESKALREAVALAATTPSVCNRQSSRVYMVRDAQTKQRILALQGGNRGFGEDINTVLVVASDMNNFRDGKERNQGFVDGGMFAMSLLLALHSKGLANIPLNWSADRRKSAKLLQMLNLPPNDLIIMMIGVGQMPETFEVAASPRRGLDDLLHEIAP